MSLSTIGANNLDLELAISQGEIPTLQIQWRVNNCIMSFAALIRRSMPLHLPIHSMIPPVV